MPTSFQGMEWFRRACKALLVSTGLLVLPFLLSSWLGWDIFLSRLLAALAIGAVATIAVLFGLMVLWITLEGITSIAIGVRVALRQRSRL